MTNDEHLSRHPRVPPQRFSHVIFQPLQRALRLLLRQFPLGRHPRVLQLWHVVQLQIVQSPPDNLRKLTRRRGGQDDNLATSHLGIVRPRSRRRHRRHRRVRAHEVTTRVGRTGGARPVERPDRRQRRVVVNGGGPKNLTQMFQRGGRHTRLPRRRVLVLRGPQRVCVLAEREVHRPPEVVRDDDVDRGGDGVDQRASAPDAGG
mmetsp:Transcript_65/g.240  ORF Transcript_65/g.240 Transcript_65/m.240 type:complete len:204 (-) Transcript_65:920-1531(-)